MKTVFIKFSLLTSFFISINLYAEGCFSYLREDSGFSTPARIASAQIRDECVANMVLDFRMYNTFKDPSKPDTLIWLQTEFCNYDKQITLHSNHIFDGFTCVIK